MTGVDYFSDAQAINPYMDDTAKIDLASAAKDHAFIKQTLQSVGIKVIQIKPPKDCQDGVYTANWALVRNGKAVLARLPGPRKGEEAYAKKALEDLGIKTYELPDGLKFSGQGDALPCGDLLFCGSGYRTDEAVHQFLADKLGYQLVELENLPLLDDTGRPSINPVSGWPDSYFYDIDLTVAILRAPSKGRRGLLAYCPDAMTPASQQKMAALEEVDKIEVSLFEAKEKFACNLVSTGQTVIMNEGATELAANIEAAGLTVVKVTNGELAKGGGSIRCTTLTLDNA